RGKGEGGGGGGGRGEPQNRLDAEDGGEEPDRQQEPEPDVELLELAVPAGEEQVGRVQTESAPQRVGQRGDRPPAPLEQREVDDDREEHPELREEEAGETPARARRGWERSPPSTIPGPGPPAARPRRAAGADAP